MAEIVSTKFSIIDDMSAHIDKIVSNLETLNKKAKETGDTLKNTFDKTYTTKFKANGGIPSGLDTKSIGSGGIPSSNIFTNIANNGSLLQNLFYLSGTIGQIGRIIKAVVSAFSQTIGAISKYTDEINLSLAKLKLVSNNDADYQKNKNLIYEAANRTYSDITDFTNQVAKLQLSTNKSFGNTENAIKFVEILNKAFVIGGADESERRGATLQITQAIGSGRLQGDEFRSVIENAPLIARQVAKAMKIPYSQLKQYSSDGKITAEILKKAVLESSDFITEQFEKIPKTMSMGMTVFSNIFKKKMEMVAVFMRNLANSTLLGEFIAKIVSGVGTLIQMIAQVFSVITTIIGIVVRGMLWLGNEIYNLITKIPYAKELMNGFGGSLGKLRAIIVGVVSALILYIVALTALKTATIIYNVALFSLTAITNISKLAIWAWGVTVSVVKGIVIVCNVVLGVFKFMFMAITNVTNISKLAIWAWGVTVAFVKGVVAIVIVVFYLLKFIISATTKEIWAHTIAWLCTPYGAIIALIIGIVVGLIALIAWLVGAGDESETFGQRMLGVIYGICAAVANVGIFVWNLALTILGSISGIIKGIGELIDAGIEGVGGLILTLVRKWMEKVGSLFEGAAGFIDKLFGSNTKDIVVQYNKFMTSGVGALENKAYEKWNNFNFMESFKSGYDFFAQFKGNYISLSGAYNTGVEHAKTVGEYFSKAKDGLGSIFKDIKSQIGDAYNLNDLGQDNSNNELESINGELKKVRKNQEKEWKEDWKLLYELATRQATVNVTRPELNLNVTVEGDNKNIETYHFADNLADKVSEIISAFANKGVN